MEPDNEASQAAQSSEGGRERSTIDFPYTDLDNACAIVKGVHRVGGTACDYDQLAAELGVEAKGGGFRLRVNGAKTYGLISYERGGRISLSDLGRKIVDPHQERVAKIDAFLAVPLFLRAYEQFKGGPLPPQAGLEGALKRMGVGSKVVDKARQVMLRSAKQAGFFDAASDRLVKPSIRQGVEHSQHSQEPSRQSDDERKSVAKTQDGGSGGGKELHPLVEGLLLTLPVLGEHWEGQERVNWLRMAESIFKMIYPDPGQKQIDIALKGDKNNTP